MPKGYYFKMSILFMLLAFVRVLVYCFYIAITPYNRAIKQTRWTRDVVLYVDCFQPRPQSYFLATFNAVNFGTANALFNSIDSLAIAIPAYKISNRNLYIWSHRNNPNSTTKFLPWNFSHRNWEHENTPSYSVQTNITRKLYRQIILTSFIR